MLKTCILNKEFFRGKAIVVFDYIDAKLAIESHFNVNIFKKLAIFCFKGYFGDYYLRPLDRDEDTFWTEKPNL